MSKASELFKQELKGIKPCTPEETESLLQKLQTGDKNALNRLTEGHLFLVDKAATVLQDKGVDYMDLVQEGCMSLSEYLVNLKALPASFQAEVAEHILQGMNAYIEEEQNAKGTGELMAKLLNAIDDFTVDFAEKNGREPSASEIADKLQIPEEEVEELLKVAIAAVKKED